MSMLLLFIRGGSEVIVVVPEAANIRTTGVFKRAVSSIGVFKQPITSTGEFRQSIKTIGRFK